MNDLNRQPIGVFDSGLGGLTVLHEIIQQLPGEDIIYFGDTARVPYGSRSIEAVTHYTFQAINFLLAQKVKMVVIACNTATALSLEKARQKYTVPILGVIEPGARAAVKASKGRVIGIIGTEGTVRSKAYENALLSLDSDLILHSTSCPLFVPLVEEGWQDTKIASLTALEYLQPLKDNQVDTLVLGCTHYPFLTQTLSRIMGDQVVLINPAYETAAVLKEDLSQLDCLNPEKVASYRYYVSDQPNKFIRIGEKFLERPIEQIETVQIQKY